MNSFELVNYHAICINIGHGTYLCVHLISCMLQENLFCLQDGNTSNSLGFVPKNQVAPRGLWNKNQAHSVIFCYSGRKTISLCAFTYYYSTTQETMISEPWEMAIT